MIIQNSYDNKQLFMVSNDRCSHFKVFICNICPTIFRCLRHEKRNRGILSWCDSCHMGLVKKSISYEMPFPCYQTLKYHLRLAPTQKWFSLSFRGNLTNDEILYSNRTLYFNMAAHADVSTTELLPNKLQSRDCIRLFGGSWFVGNSGAVVAAIKKSMPHQRAWH